jgi:TrmH family RNA methyltransferase
MKSIASADNPLFKSLKSLHASKGRRELGLFIAEGPHLAEEALKAGADIRYAVVMSGAEEKYAPLLRAFGETAAEALSLAPKLFGALADTDTPQGILTIVGIKKCALEDAVSGASRIAVVLERVQDPGNVGTVLRTALAVGAGFAAITQDCADPWSQKAVRASQGAVLRLPIVEVANAADAAAALNANGWHTACGCLDGGNFFEREPHARTAVVIGNEAAGVSAETMAACTAKYTLPMPGGVESLNAAIAAGIMLYDIWREQSQ